MTKEERKHMVDAAKAKYLGRLVRIRYELQPEREIITGICIDVRAATFEDGTWVQLQVKPGIGPEQWWYVDVDDYVADVHPGVNHGRT